MAGKRNTPRRDWRQTVFIILSLLLVLAMALGFVLPFLLPGNR